MKQDMSNEKGPREILSEGWHKFSVDEVELAMSSTGNEMLIWELTELENKTGFTLMTTCIKGKRWLLKQALTACGIIADDKGYYEYEITDLSGKIFEGRIKHFPEDWINREGQNVSSVKDRIIEIRETLPF